MISRCQSYSNILDSWHSWKERSYREKIDLQKPEPLRNYYKVPNILWVIKIVYQFLIKKLQSLYYRRVIKGIFFQGDLQSLWPSSTVAQGEVIILQKSIPSVSPRTLYLLCWVIAIFTFPFMEALFSLFR